MFEEINDRLRRECFHLRNEVDPLRTILETTAGFELPLYYALRNLMGDIDSPEIAAGLSGLLVDGRKIKFPEPPASATSRLTFDTVLYCAHHAVPLQQTVKGPKNTVVTWWESPSEDELRETMASMRTYVDLEHDRYRPVARGPAGRLQAWDPTFARWESVETDEDDGERGFWEARYSLASHAIRYLECFLKLPVWSRNSFQCSWKWLRFLVDERLENTRDVTIGNRRPADIGEFRRLYGRNVPEYYFFEEEVAPVKLDEVD